MKGAHGPLTIPALSVSFDARDGFVWHCRSKHVLCIMKRKFQFTRRFVQISSTVTTAIVDRRSAERTGRHETHGPNRHHAHGGCVNRLDPRGWSICRRLWTRGEPGSWYSYQRKCRGSAPPARKRKTALSAVRDLIRDCCRIDFHASACGYLGETPSVDANSYQISKNGLQSDTYLQPAA